MIPSVLIRALFKGHNLGAYYTVDLKSSHKFDNPRMEDGNQVCGLWSPLVGSHDAHEKKTLGSLVYNDQKKITQNASIFVWGEG